MRLLNLLIIVSFMLLNVPVAEANEPAMQSYRVQDRDTLKKIANKLKVNLKSLYQLNRETIGKNPDLIHPGVILLIPQVAPKQTDSQNQIRGATLGELMQPLNIENGMSTTLLQPKRNAFVRSRSDTLTSKTITPKMAIPTKKMAIGELLSMQTPFNAFKYKNELYCLTCFVALALLVGFILIKHDQRNRPRTSRIQTEQYDLSQEMLQERLAKLAQPPSDHGHPVKPTDFL